MAKAFVDEEIKKPAVVFSKSYCPFCKMAKSVLNEVGAKYAVHELDERGIQTTPTYMTCYYVIGVSGTAIFYLSLKYISNDVAGSSMGALNCFVY